jgi:hypothetical protein
MYLTYSKSLAMFDQCMVQLELDKPNDSKVYVEFQEGFIPLAAKYYESFYAPVVAVEEVPVVDYADPAPVPVHAPVEPVVSEVIVEEVPVVDVVRPDPVSVPAAVVAPAESVVVPAPVAKKARKASV